MEKLILKYSFYRIVAFSPSFFLFVFYGILIPIIKESGLMDHVSHEWSLWSWVFVEKLSFFMLVLVPLYLVVCSLYYLTKNQAKGFPTFVLIFNIIWTGFFAMILMLLGSV